ncbi:MAG: HAMP domain-containing sensor histidine kinase [Gordonia sp. (in: high G+C Gram-positive bacteria)]|uniref:HAMP domain-containing sensor histidine kinase n=1 Tax=Gordonia sp. (in: high G+C Gram-positive bacteria) TaxID=84139 RepID=UPI0039E4AC2A
MRIRLLKTMIATLAAMAMLLGVPLTVGVWSWISATAHSDLADRLKTMSEHVLAEEASGRLAGPSELRLERFHLLVPPQGNLRLSGPAGSQEVGARPSMEPISESVTLGPGYTLTLSIPRSEIRPTQWLAVGLLILVITGSVGGGALIAALTARRLTDPLTRVAGRAEAMARGDLSTAWPEYGIAELDQVSAALADANAEIARRLEREGQIIGDVSHQLRSRLTAISLRLDELTLHPDPAVVAEAQEGVAQVERLARELDELVSASRAQGGARTELDVLALVETLIDDFAGPFASQDRAVRLTVGEPPRTVHGRPGRLREALSTLLDNSLRHGAGTTQVRVDDLGSAGAVRITVSDEGPGVPDEIAPDIFRRGFSGGSGTGVGLSLARALVEADGGRLSLAARRPAVFSVVVPVDAQGEDDAPAVRDLRR